MSAERAPGKLGIVVIGRNEGERLKACLDSLAASAYPIVYVDSGSTDGSAAQAADMVDSVVRLDPARPFTAARARNEGAARLLERFPGLTLIQFVDGDCVLDPAWLGRGIMVHEQSPGTAVVCGRRRELHPDASIYNRLCDMEWDTPTGEADSSGGDFLVRVAAFRAVDGFNSDMIAGEEPELCYRLRSAGWRIQRIPHEMTLHDADISRFSQFWLRAKRAGHAYAQGAYLHSGDGRGFRWREVRSIIFYSALLPLALLFLSLLLGPLLLALLPVTYLALAVRVYLGRRVRKESETRASAAIYATSVVVGKFAQLLGVLEFFTSQWVKKPRELIEYK
ncbi:glycosyltransferase family 2 protein [Microbulbifer zhoushanensis]|uniref:glycosyltransferase family 2 protein n=1 Tax=Microbulbifer zhoushanensis TaxID=2904254 RepID=UPI001F3ABFEB|nr:glycosyltransferase [Microbulbifer zhoushanensis]